MYYTTYDTFKLEPRPSIHARCWVLGDYVLCNEFKNYAMRRLFKEHVDFSILFGSAISSGDVEHVCSSTAPDSKLRQFYMNCLADRFTNIKMLRGATADWDKILQNHPKTRSDVYSKMRYPKTIHMKEMEEYLEGTENKQESDLRMDVGLAGLAIGEAANKPAETTGDGDLVKVSDSACYQGNDTSMRQPSSIRAFPELIEC